MPRLNLSAKELADLDQFIAGFRDHLFNLSHEALSHRGDSTCMVSNSLCAGPEVWEDLLAGTGGHPISLAVVGGAGLILLGETRLENERLQAKLRERRG